MRRSGRRGFFRHVLQDLAATGGELAGRPAVSPALVAGWSDERLGRLVPVLAPPERWQGKDMVLSTLEEALRARFDGGATLSAISDEVAAARQAEPAAVFAVCRALFLRLADAWLVAPTPESLGADAREGGAPEP